MCMYILFIIFYKVMKKLYMHRSTVQVLGSYIDYYRKIMLFWCLIFGFIGLSAKLKLSDLKAVKASIMCLTFHARVVHFFAMLKRTSIYKNYLWLLSQKIFSPSTPNLGAQIMFALSWYTAVQTDQKISHVFWKGLWFNCLI